ncbi:MAG TPA: GNAT family N-acetyltransferase, partial [Stellaceae bacterium]|nr:GNAT family N-acetyltransferase [Stellaceae bacterium]
MSGRLELRRAGAADAAAVRDLTREAYAKWVPLIGREPKPMTADYTKAVRRHVIDMIYVDGELAGLIEIIPESDHLLIENLAVSPRFQARGLGEHLLEHAEALTVSRGHDVIRLYTNKLFEANIAFYLKRGYRLDREEPFPGGSIVVHMSKRLQP